MVGKPLGSLLLFEMCSENKLQKLKTKFNRNNDSKYAICNSSVLLHFYLYCPNISIFFIGQKKLTLQEFVLCQRTKIIQQWQKLLPQYTRIYCEAVTIYGTVSFTLA